MVSAFFHKETGLHTGRPTMLCLVKMIYWPLELIGVHFGIGGGGQGVLDPLLRGLAPHTPAQFFLPTPPPFPFFAYTPPKIKIFLAQPPPIWPRPTPMFHQEPPTPASPNPRITCSTWVR